MRELTGTNSSIGLIALIMWGQTVIVDNRPGASGNLAAGVAARAPADGYTILVGVDAIMTSNIHLFKNIAYHPEKDFAPITNVGANIIALAVHQDLPVNSVAELIAYAKANPGKLNYASSGLASPHHLAGELLQQKAGIKLTHVPYKGGGAAVKDLIGGHIPMGFLSMSAAIPARETGKVKLLAVVEKDRYAAMPDLPTIAETVPGFEMTSWLGLFVPAGTPQPIIAKLNEEIVKIIRSDDIKARFAALGFAVVGSTPEEMAATVKSGLEVRGELIKAAGIQPD
jgi:tripartite-type tricarboxylate transporter receptor subunit TctC